MEKEKMTKAKEIQLKVVEALQDDAYKGMARIDSEIMRELDVRRGEPILIKGGRETVDHPGAQGM